MTLSRHDLDLFSLVTGLATTTFAVVALTDSWTRPLAGWFWPVVLVAAGVLLLGLAVGVRPRRPADAGGPDAPAAPAPDPWDGDLVEELRDDASPDPTWAREVGAPDVDPDATDAVPDAPDQG